MIASAALAAAIAVALSPQLAGQQQQTAPDRAGPEAEILASLSSGLTPDQLCHRFRDEYGDNAWAIRATPGIHERYTRMPAAARYLEGLSVSCGATLCQVIGWTRSGVSGDDVRAVMNEVQSGDLNVAIEQLGLTISSSSFTAAPNDRDGMAFVSYLERKAGA